METKPRLILATRNAHKTAEIRAMIGDRYEVLDATAFPALPAIDETGTTFLENARLKAEGISREIAGLVLSDDSGLAVNVTGDAGNGTIVRGYGGVGSLGDVYASLPHDAWADADWSGTTSGLSFAWSGWHDPQSYLDHVEFSVVELGEAAGYGPEQYAQEGSLLERAPGGALGEDAARRVLQQLARGLRYHLEDRVLTHGNKTVVFR
jgi:hypothetical protein